MLIIENITKKYNSKINNETVALKNVNLSFMNKEMIFILGPSGCGKTTLMNIIGGLDIPSNGVVKINNTCIGTSEEEIDVYRSNYIGFIFQNFNLIDNLSIYDNLLLVCYNKNDEKMISYYLEKVGLKDYEDRFPNELSGGQVQRVAIARALLKKSDILLADEPTGNLNEELSAEIFNLLKNISKDKLVIVTTHNKEMANLYADRIIEMNDGVIVTDKVVAPKSNELLIEKRNDNTISSKKILKLAVRNFKTSKLDIMFNLIILLLSFICSALTFSIANYNRVDTDVKNLKKMNEIETFSLERYSYNDELGRYVSYAQIEEIKKNNKNIKYIQDGVITCSKDLFDFGLVLYDNYNEISNDGIYVYEYIIKDAIQNEKLYYDNSGNLIVENKENIQYNNLVNTYLLFEKYGIKNYIRVDGIVKNIVDLKKHSFFESNEEKAKHYYYNVFQERINVFYLKESIYAKLFSINDYVSAYTSFTDGPFEILLNNVRIENYEILFSETLYGNFKFQIGDLILTEDNLITDFNEDANNELFSFVNNNEIYISLALYNLIFNEYSNFDYYIEKVGFKKYRIKNIPKHIGESISLNIIDYYFDSYNLNYDELIIKGIIFDEYSFGYGGGIIISNSKYEEINRFVSKPNIYMLKSSIENIESFVKECMKLTIRTNYICSNEIDTFEENVKMLKLIFLILSIILLVISFVVLYSMVNRMIRKSKKEFGILKAIGISNQDIIISFKMLIYVIMIILMIFIVPLSSILIYLINNIIVQEIYLGLTIIYYKWWYCLVTAFFIFVIMMISSKLILSKFSKMKAIDLIKSINN